MLSVGTPGFTDMNAVWDLAETQRLIEHPAVRLLRSPNCALTLTFLHRAFKEHHAIAVPESHLRARLENFLDEARSHRPGAYQQTAAEYLSALDVGTGKNPAGGSRACFASRIRLSLRRSSDRTRVGFIKIESCCPRLPSCTANASTQ